MYFLYRYHHILPSTYFKLPIGEKIVVNAFVSYEIEKRIEESESLKGN
nr:MAG TPA: hypothetical protein [Caudoviricetes sp.]